MCDDQQQGLNRPSLLLHFVTTVWWLACWHSSLEENVIHLKKEKKHA